MRIVSLVPSWTETLIESGLNVVGRTRYCLHPSKSIQSIEIVGGTKSIDLEKVKALKPDLIVLDKEENTKEMAESLVPFKQWASHIQSLNDMPQSLLELSQVTSCDGLKRMSEQWAQLLLLKPKSFQPNSLPGIKSWIREPLVEPKKILYLIWHKPWMSVSEQTFIGSVLEFLGAGSHMVSFHEKYPAINLDNYNSPDTLILASSEPYPFESKTELFKDFQNPVAIVDGELYSWFGIRSFQGLQKALEKNSST